MSIYTKKGDRGKTLLYGGELVFKNDIRIETYGMLDELSSFLGILILKTKGEEKKYLTLVQKDLYLVMSALCKTNVSISFLDDRINDFERKIEKVEKKLPLISNFILPQGSEISVWYHICRVICRRAERKVVDFLKSNKTSFKKKSLIIKYLNRLSDLFFILARQHNKGKELIV